MSSEMPQLEPLSVLNLQSQVRDRIRDAILEGTYKPGGRLIEMEIAGQLGVSRAPVREALAALEREGIIINAPRRGYMVIDFTDSDIDEIYSLRLLLEIGALRRAMSRFTDEDIFKMQSVINRLDEAAHHTNDPGPIVALDLSFHEHICRRADHGRLLSAWDSMRLQTKMLIGVTSRTHYQHPEGPKELHQSILDAICGKDLENAESILTDHILDAQKRAVTALRALHSYGGVYAEDH
jgi:DNA-binding GntR family transcriptional regulator